jgi:hypothetical protein
MNSFIVLTAAHGTYRTEAEEFLLEDDFFLFLTDGSLVGAIDKDCVLGIVKEDICALVPNP